MTQTTEDANRTHRGDAASTPAGSAPTARDLRASLLEGLAVTDRRIELAGIPTAILEGGEGPSVILLHGPGEHGLKWHRVMEDLLEDHHVMAPDLPGHGASGSGEGPLEASRVLGWLDALVDGCEDRPVLVGQIVGGAIAARYAIEHGDRVGALVLADALGLAPFRPAARFGEALEAFVKEPDPERYDRLWEYCAADLDGLRERMGDRWRQLKEYSLDRARKQDVRAAMGALMEHFGHPPIPQEELARISVPTVLVWGREDLATDVSVAEETNRRFGWPLYVIEDAADDPALERPEAFLATLRAALERQKLSAAWSSIATGYDELVTSSHGWLAEKGLDAVGLRPGMRFLDIAAGTGALSLPAAARGADVTATDISPVMLEELVTRAEADGLEVETRVMDGHDLTFDDDTFDVAGSQFGVMLFDDAPRAIREMARVVRPGGSVLLTVFGDPSEVDFLRFFVGAVRRVRPGFELPTDPPPLPFQFRDPSTLRDAMEDSGLEQVTVSSVMERMELRDGRHLWGWLLNSNPIPGAILSRLGITEDEEEVIEAALSEMVRDRAGGSGTAVLESPVHIAVGSK